MIHYHLGVFIAFGLSGCIPAFHYVFAYGFFEAVREAGFVWLVLMGTLYITGELLPLGQNDWMKLTNI